VCGDDCNDKTGDKFVGLGTVSILQPNGFGLSGNAFRLSVRQLYGRLELQAKSAVADKYLDSVSSTE